MYFNVTTYKKFPDTVSDFTLELNFNKQPLVKKKKKKKLAWLKMCEFGSTHMDKVSSGYRRSFGPSSELHRILALLRDNR